MRFWLGVCSWPLWGASSRRSSRPVDGWRGDTLPYTPQGRTVLHWGGGSFPLKLPLHLGFTPQMWHGTLTSLKHRHIGAKKRVLWSSKYAKMCSPSRTPLGELMTLRRLLVGWGGDTHAQTPSHWVIRHPAPRFVAGFSHIFGLELPQTLCMHFLSFQALFLL